MSNNEPTETTRTTIINDPTLLLQKGIVQAPIPSQILNVQYWATELSRITPLIATSEDGEYAFYRNILEEPDFPFDDILHSPSSPIGKAIQKYFRIQDLKSEIRLDDAFCVHYNTTQSDTTCAKHIDPSDITVNLCLEKSQDVMGSMVMFYGAQRLFLHDDEYDSSSSSCEEEHEKQNNNIETNVITTDTTAPNNDQNHRINNKDNDDDDDDDKTSSSSFLVNQKEGYATIHWGHHPHETTPLKSGTRTNIILTYCYTDKNRSGSDVAMRCCYAMSS